MFANNLKQLRKSKGLTQVQFAEIFNISSGTIAMWETNKRVPDISMLKRIANYFDVTVDFLLSDGAIQITDKPYIIELRAADELPDDTPDKAESSSAPSDEDIKFALFDGSEGVTDEMYDEVKRFAKYIKEQKEKK